MRAAGTQGFKSHLTSTLTALGAVWGALALSACDPNVVVEDAPEPELGATRGIYIPIQPSQARALAAETETRAALAEPLPIYIHRNGGTYYGGSDDSSQNRSSVVGSGSATISAFSGGDAVWNEMMDCITDQFSRFNAYVTDVEPTSGDYIESVVGGYPQEVGLPQGVGGVAPIDTFQCNIIADAVVYVFSEALPNDAQLLCEVAAQEIAHALSLDHELLCEDPMTYLSGCGDKSFQDINAQCGEFQARPCDCGRPSQNSVQILYDKLGAASGEPPPPPVEDTAPPSVSITSPSDGASLAPNSQIQVVATADDDLGLAAVELLWEYSGDSFPCPVTGNGYSCEVQGNSYVWNLTVGTGARTFQVRVRDLGGNEVITQPRTISLDDGADPGEPPPVDTLAPEVAIASPVDGATLNANNVIEVVGTATDDFEVTDMELVWDYSGDVFPCPTNQQAVSCERQGSTYRWQVNVGTGERNYRLRARDGAGNVSQTDTRTIILSETLVLPPEEDSYEDNDTWDTATPIACSSGLDLRAVPGDSDWLMANVQPGIVVRAAVTSNDGANLNVALASGPRSADVITTDTTTSSKSVAAQATTSSVGIRVDSLDIEGEYRVVLSCEEPDPNDPDPVGPGDDPTQPNPGQPGTPLDGVDVGGERVSLQPVGGNAPASCASAGLSPSWLGLMALLGGLAIRRRRR
jgi:hypothetical protein